MYQILLTKKADRALNIMPRDVSQLVRRKLDQIAAMAPSSNLSPQAQKYPGRRFYVDDWHVIYEKTGKDLTVLSSGHRPGRRFIEMTVQIIEKNNKPEWAVMPYEMYQQLVEDAETLQDMRDYKAAKKVIKNGDELIPGPVTYAILDGEKPIKVWRKYRGLTQRQLSEMAGITKAYLSQIETGKRTGTTDVLTNIARSLDLTLDDIVG